MSGSYFHTVFCFVFSSWPSQLSYQSCSLKTLNLIRCATSVYKIYNFWKLHAGGRHQTSPWPLCTCLISLQIKCPQHFLPKLISYGSSAPLGDLQSSFPYDSGYWQLGKGTHLWLMATQKEIMEKQLWLHWFDFSFLPPYTSKEALIWTSLAMGKCMGLWGRFSWRCLTRASPTISSEAHLTATLP